MAFRARMVQQFVSFMVDAGYDGEVHLWAGFRG